jgi:hypothetical protein
MIKVFYLERSTKVRQVLRRYTRDGGECSDISNHGFHEAPMVVLGDVEVPEMPKDEYHVLEAGTAIVDNGMIGPIRADDPRWPIQCTCGYKFRDDDGSKRYWPQRLYRRTDNGELHTLRDAPLGAMWHVDYYNHTGPDGQCLVVRIPKHHDWMVDSRASNCDSPCKYCGRPYQGHTNATCSNPGDGQRPYTVGSYEDIRPEHRCWVRHGDAKTGNVHVDKNGITCNAGAGSIISPDGWHGFLHNGYLTSC